MLTIRKAYQTTLSTLLIVISAFFKSRKFIYRGKPYNYFYHWSNWAYLNERVVEVSIVWEVIKLNRGKRILEVGNVLSQYFTIGHDVLDKYEIALGVVNQDVVDFKPSSNYDLIVSISTLEHVGWDEEPREPLKILRAIDNLMNCLNSNGMLLVTLPIGYNSVMDEILENETIPFTERRYMKRVSRGNRWVEAEWSDVKGLKYSSPPSANGLVIGIIRKIP
jgi:hypothetical protein